jgi:acetyltransferase-like isoleucine patch superfamily enzyme
VKANNAPYYLKLGGYDFCRKVISVMGRKLQWKPFRKAKAFFYFKTWGITIGRNVRIHGLPFNITVGRRTIFYDNCVFEFGHASEVNIGSEVVFSYGVVFCCRHKITIGNDVQIGEYSSVRDSTHRHDQMDKPMKFSSDIELPIVISNDVWIGRGCLILPGTVIEEGVVVAANSVVKGLLEKNGIYGGNPAKFIKHRTA